MCGYLYLEFYTERFLRIHLLWKWLWVPKPINIGFVFYSKINLCGISITMFIDDLNKTRMLYIAQYLAIAHHASCFDDRYSSPQLVFKSELETQSYFGYWCDWFLPAKVQFRSKYCLRRRGKDSFKILSNIERNKRRNITR